MTRKSLAPGARYDPATNGRGTFAVTAREPHKRCLRGGEAAVLERIGERPPQRNGRATRGRVVTTQQRWF